MPVYLLTLHAYRSWTEDNPRGFVKKGERGVHPPNRGLAKHRADRARHAPVRFTPSQRGLLLDATRDIAARRGWRLHAASATPTRVHVLVSWTDAAAADLVTKFKQLLGMTLSKDAGSKGNRWFSAGSDRTRVADRAHLDELRNRYLPKHRLEGGVVWVER